ncbi:MAG: hypothetical protein Q9219_003171 [cf. Caloplaca sp. 3 TL-2023]
MRKAVSPSDRFSFEDAQWFQSLPDKVQKNHFTAEEQQVLATRRNSAILDAADEVLLRIERQRIQSVPTVPTVQPKASSLSSASSVHTLEDEPPTDSAVDMDESIFDGFRWMDDEDELDLSLDDYHSHLAGSAEPASRHSSRRPSFRRTPSLTGVSCRVSDHRTSHEKDPRTTSSTPLQRASPRTSFYIDDSRSRTEHQLSTAPKPSPPRTINPSTRHYQDPEARLKLRVYLASPSKFDEALEFGFPSLQNTDKLPQPRRPSMSRTYNTDPAPQTFYDSDNPSFLDGSDTDDDGAESLPEMDAPHTPSDAMFSRYIHRIPTSKPPSSEVERSYAKTQERPTTKSAEPQLNHPHYMVSRYNREMTMRVTLTRPDLRANEDLLYGHMDNDPLALEHLPATVDGGDIWDQGKENEGAVRKFWRKFSRR